MKEQLPRIFVNYPYHRLEKDSNDEWHWVGETIEVEVLTIHFRTGTMRVRSVEKISQTGDKPEICSFDLPSGEFFKHYSLLELNGV